MLSAALIYVGMVGVIVLLGFASTGISYLALRKNILEPSKTSTLPYHPVRRS